MALQDEWIRLTIRIPPDLHERIQSAALKKAQPINAEIVEALSKEYPETSPMIDIFNRIMALVDLTEGEKYEKFREEISELMVDFITVASKENPKLKPFVELGLKARANRRSGRPVA